MTADASLLRPISDLPRFYQQYLTYKERDEKVAQCWDIQDIGKLNTYSDQELNGVIFVNSFWRCEKPLETLENLVRILKPGSSAIFLEPLLSPVSFCIGKFTHPNALNHTASPFDRDQQSRINFATPSLLFDRIENRLELLTRFPELTFTHRSRRALLTNLIPKNSAFQKQAAALDHFLLPILGNFAASYMKVTLTRK